MDGPKLPDSNDLLKAGKLPVDPMLGANPIPPKRNGKRNKAPEPPPEMFSDDDAGLIDCPTVAPPPNDLVAEAAVLSAILFPMDAQNQASVFAEVAALAPHHFWSDPNRLIYAAILSLRSEGLPVDAVTVRGRLADRGQLERIGGERYLDDLMLKVPATAYPGEYAKIILEKDLGRRLRDLAHRVTAHTEQSNFDVARVREELEQLQLLSSDHGGAESDLDAAAPSFESAYTDASLDADERSSLISVATLPGWPPRGAFECPSTGHGLGGHLNSSLAYGFRRGEIVAIGAPSAGAGKTQWLHQLLDGLALRNLDGIEHPGSTLTPVLMLSEMSAQALTWRSLSRWTGYDAAAFRSGASYPNVDASREAFEAGRQSLREGPFALSRAWFRLLDNSRNFPERAPAFVEYLARLLDAWRRSIARQHPGHDITPILALDPIQRWQSGDDEVTALNLLSKLLRVFAEREQWIVLTTSDTNKSTASGGSTGPRRTDQEEAVSAFRGSYNLIHEASTVLYLRRPPKAAPVDAPPYPVEVVVAKARWGSGTPWPRFDWYPSRARFVPLSREETVRQIGDEIEAVSTGRKRCTETELEDRIFAAVRSNPNLRNPTMIVEVVKGKRGQVLQRVKDLIKNGRLVHGDTGLRVEGEEDSSP